jgi:hypothetical protein
MAITPLFKKLNLGTHGTIHVLNAPASFDAELAALDGVDVKRTLRGATQFVLAFAVTEAERDAACRQIVKAAEGDAIVWMVYPKQTSRTYKAEFNRDSEWTILRDADFDTVRMVAIDTDWSALRFRRAAFIAAKR